MSLIALHFETANRHRASACHVAAVLFERGRVTEQFVSVIRPPAGSPGRFDPLCTALHGIGPSDVAEAPTFAELWPLLQDLLGRAPRVVAHTASFHGAVLAHATSNLDAPPALPPVECVLTRARRLLPRLQNHRLPTVCAALHLPLPDAAHPAGRALAAALAADALDWLEVMPAADHTRRPELRRAPGRTPTRRAA
jgi:DNA polymerase-3 subunit epsilon